MSEFDSLVKALEGHFDQSFDDLPEEIRKLVQRGITERLWILITPDERRMAAEQWDEQSNPDAEAEVERGWELGLEKEEVVRELQELRAMRAQNLAELQFKSTRCAELETRLKDLENQEQAGVTAESATLTTEKRNKVLQQDAFETAMELKRESDGTRRITKRVVAEKLSSSNRWSHLAALTIERIIVPNW